MIPRGKLSISLTNLLSALFYCFSNKRNTKFTPNTDIYGDSIFCLSARTGLHLALQSLNFPPGSQIIVCNINIPDMFAIISAHHLECAPVSLNKHTLAIDIQEIENAITPLTKAILITHLFGAVINMDEVIAFAKKHGLLVIEDCAQAFNYRYTGHSNTDVSLFSFGLIKTSTCLTGAIICFNNKPLFEKVKVLNEQLPVQRTKKYLAKVFKALAIKAITVKWIYTLLYHAAKFLKKDFDEVLAGFTKGFPGSNVMEKIRFRPCEANLRLLQNTTNSHKEAMIEKRKNTALKIIAQIPARMCIGTCNGSNSYWVLPLESAKPMQLITYLRANGIDATAKASSLISIGTDLNFKDDELNLESLVYLPIDTDVVEKIKILDLEKYA